MKSHPLHQTKHPVVSVTEDQIAIVGAACRLPGAPDEAAFANLLFSARSAVKPRPEGRWAPERFFHPRTSEPGFSYTFAGGFLDHPFDFDASVFGMSPREAQQVDPQQRLLMEVVWEALEDARIKPSSIAGKEVGVYVGASSLDHGNLHAQDLASIDSHFMTGNTLSIVSNRISYAFDLKGPSFTVDTACSSSLVAFNQAMNDLRLGRIDVAIVAGVNLLFSPASYVGFSRASMLSPTGLCRPFSADGDGYVRSEGAVALVLQRADLAVPGAARAYAVAAGVNSDGRTSGIALPGLDGQKVLLDRLYGEAGISPDRLAFVEAHGTGTRVGDPIEATAIGTALGQRRRMALPIGSVKSNIGHLEPASGVAGLMKALIALKARRLPRSLHLDTLNPLIDFADLNLTPATETRALDDTGGELLCGVSSFGFGGTNAHIILKTAPAVAPVNAQPLTTRYLALSAATREALGDYARSVATLIDSGAAPERLASEIASGRDSLKHRLVVPLERPETIARQLAEFADHGTADRMAVGHAPSQATKVAFVYSGNGVQWVGMGRTAFRRNSAFRDRFTAIDQTFTQATGQSLIQNLFATDLADRLKHTGVVQPLIFAIQSAITHSLRQAGLEPDFVIGHSVGELAAASAAGGLDLIDAIRVIESRAACQQELQGAGLMSVFAASREHMERFVQSLGRDDIEIACENGPNSITLSGSQEAIRLASRLGRKERLASRILDFEYPFHSHLLEGVRERFERLLGNVTPNTPDVPMISTVTGELLGATPLDQSYWWRNIRQPVLFRTGIETAIREGVGLFVEIGPKPILVGPVAETIKSVSSPAQVIQSLAEADERDAEQDPIVLIAARALAHGAALRNSDDAHDMRVIDRMTVLPTYPWQHRTYHHPITSEGLDLLGRERRHPLIGSRLADGQPEWRTLVDCDLVPYLADHVVDGEVVVPGAALIEMALAAGRDLSAEGPLGLEDFDILQPLTLPKGQMREISVRHTGTTGAIEIWSRPRLGTDGWTLNGRGRLVAVSRGPRARRDMGEVISESPGSTVYERASLSGIDYGPAFQRIISLKRNAKHMDTMLRPAEAGTGEFTRAQILHPASLDAALHGLFDQIKLDATVRRTYVPVRFGGVTVYRDHADIVAAEVSVIRETDHSVLISLALIDADGTVVADCEDVLLKAVALTRVDRNDVFLHVCHDVRRQHAPADEAIAARLASAEIAGQSDGWLMLRAHMRAIAHRSLLSLSDEGVLDLSTLVALGRVHADAQAYAAMLAEDLVAAGLADTDGERLVMAAESGLPEAGDILRTVAAEFPEASAELRLAALTAQAVDTFLATGEPIRISTAVRDQFEADGIVFASLPAATNAVIDALEPNARVLLLEPDCRALIGPLVSAARAGTIRLTIAGEDADRLAYLGNAMAGEPSVALLDLSREEASATARFDLAIVAAHRLEATHETLLARAGNQIAPNGRLVALVTTPDPLIDFYFGTDRAWFARSLDPMLPIGPSQSRSAIEVRLARAGFREIRTQEIAAGAVHVLIARPAELTSARLDDVPVLITGHSDAQPSTFVAEVAKAIRARGGEVVAEPVLLTGQPKRFERIEIVNLAEGDDLVRTERALSAVRSTLMRSPVTTDGFRLWIVLRGRGAVGTDPVVEAIAGFARVGLNEYGKLDIHIAEVDREADDAIEAARLAELIAQPGREREVRFGHEAIAVTRVEKGLPPTPELTKAPDAVTLDFPRRGMLEQFAWSPIARREPGAAEIEIAVLATGLNFRDVMLAMGLLGDDVLDDGMAGAVFGFECVGRVIRRGTEATRFVEGEIVVGFAASSFSSHLTGPEAMFIPLPAGLSPEAAATVPVAFLTAWYALIECARLKRGERVLIHGAAGGVGLAAMQIARSRGAEVLATVSSPDKRAVVELFGAARVYDSRSLSFGDAIRSEFGGVDVVLNSLAGDAMRMGLKCLKPFGRFVELGKRDYVANTELGLRPFRRNLTYYGVDLDQLLAHDAGLVAKGLKYVAAGLNAGRFTALPYRAYAGHEIGAAFRLMQSAGHVGKVIVRAPDVTAIRVVAEPTTKTDFNDGVQLIVGGTGGFGLATALWLAEQGAKRIVVASRRGVIDAARADEIAALKAKGVALVAERVDVTDLVDVEALIAKVTRRFGPISGVYHTAMVLDDGLIADLEPARLHSVLAPKIAGAHHLDAATRGQPVKRFVLYSSATTLIGNPGQAAYVAANAYLNGLARKRRRAGLPALSVGWGAIADAGVLTRDPETAKKLERLTGVSAMASSEALGHLGRLMAMADDLADPSVICARFQFGGMAIDLPILSTPAFAGVAQGGGVVAGGADADIKSLIAGKSETEARRLVADLVAGEVARILRLPPKDVDLDRPLSELGMDSLMALELRMCLEGKFGIELPLVAITAVNNLRDLGGRILQSIQSGDAGEADDGSASDRELILIHGGDESAYSELRETIEAQRMKVERVI
jgi:phthiocerol/phenolphthiocerol synthesis type-I polyketide synthase C